MNKIPKVSILIPTYNREILIGECIQSALNQTYIDIEVIVVDNASTDGTWNICQEYAALDPRIRIFRNETNIGPVRNWLRCVSEARGEYSKILFSDDLVAPEYIANTLPLLQNPVIAFVYTAAYIGEAIGKGTVEYVNHSKTLYPVDEYFELLRRARVPFSPGAAIFRTADIKKNLHDTLPTYLPHEFWKHGAGPDVMLYALTALDYTSVAAIDEPLVLFRAHAGSISTTNANNEVLEGYRAALSWFFKKHFSHSTWIDYIAWQWIDELKICKPCVRTYEYLKKYGGSATLQEQMQFWIIAILFVCLRSWRKIGRICNK